MSPVNNSATATAVDTKSDRASTAYILSVLSVLGVFAVISAVLMAWPALSYLGAKLG